MVTARSSTFQATPTVDPFRSAVYASESDVLALLITVGDGALRLRRP